LGAEIPDPTVMKFCMSGAIHDIIMCANFGEDQLMGFGVGMGEGSNFGLFHLLVSSHYNTHALRVSE